MSIAALLEAADFLERRERGKLKGEIFVRYPIFVNIGICSQYDDSPIFIH